MAFWSFELYLTSWPLLFDNKDLIMMDMSGGTVVGHGGSQPPRHDGPGTALHDQPYAPVPGPSTET